jgi:hypothetical protein
VARREAFKGLRRRSTYAMQFNGVERKRGRRAGVLVAASVQERAGEMGVTA